MLTNVNKGGGGVKSMLTLARGIEVRYSKTQIFPGGNLLCSIKYNSRVVVGGKTVKKSSCVSNMAVTLHKNVWV